MACTRKFYDDDETKDNLQRDTGIGRYMLNCPGNGPSPDYFNDPHIRLQKQAANNATNIIDVNNYLRGLNKNLSRDSKVEDTSNKTIMKPNENYRIINNITDESRATNPAWELRGLEQNNMPYLHYNPQEKTEIPFTNNLNTRMLEKDYYNDC